MAKASITPKEALALLDAVTVFPWRVAKEPPTNILDNCEGKVERRRVRQAWNKLYQAIQSAEKP